MKKKFCKKKYWGDCATVELSGFLVFNVVLILLYLFDLFVVRLRLSSWVPSSCKGRLSGVVVATISSSFLANASPRGLYFLAPTGWSDVFLVRLPSRPTSGFLGEVAPVRAIETTWRCQRAPRSPSRIGRWPIRPFHRGLDGFSPRIITYFPNTYTGVDEAFHSFLWLQSWVARSLPRGFWGPHNHTDFQTKSGEEFVYRCFSVSIVCLITLFLMSLINLFSNLSSGTNFGCDFGWVQVRW